jgi:hypothetical protein
MFGQVLPRHIHHCDHFVLEVAWEARIQPREHLEYVCDSLTKISKQFYNEQNLHTI